jgi:hypothetical protein
MIRTQTIRIAICLIALPTGILPLTAGDQPDAKTQEPFPAAMKPFADKLLDIAKKYERFGRVDDEFRWAPWLCRSPNPGTVAFSASKDKDTHGQKLYSLFASDRPAYAQLQTKKQAPVGQVIVKESWTPEPSDAPPQKDVEFRKLNAKDRHGEDLVDHFSPYVQRDGKWFKASKKAGLFVMMKYDPKTEGTDEGWVYATVSADLKQVTSIGKVASCMECHVKAKFDRQFGRGMILP